MVGHAADGPGTDTHYITLKRSGTQVTGIAGPEDANWAIQDARLDGKKLTFQVAVPGSEMLLAYELQLTGDELAGTLEARKGPPVKGKLRLKGKKIKTCGSRSFSVAHAPQRDCAVPALEVKLFGM